MGLKGPIKAPIALLEMGKTAQIILDLSFPDPPVTFTLVKGSGPVHIVGHNLLEKGDNCNWTPFYECGNGNTVNLNRISNCKSI
ncbi:hypothetical protein E2986_02971 [Frieseomelitta varia]|uniref:Nucleoplasmin core domain-containing protein n=1 Tax=Frieseomelitta varia TaxID=561572 RepID=A0A833W4Q3_9HYME|nr:hypothetical protein E2986_02971 [Frieseomelitta varia]